MVAQEVLLSVPLSKREEEIAEVGLGRNCCARVPPPPLPAVRANNYAKELVGKRSFTRRMNLRRKEFASIATACNFFSYVFFMLIRLFAVQHNAVRYSAVLSDFFLPKELM